ncbi:hypothetical protein C8A03DRAFT_36783 [Achaetomium macrosporum]|uniref:Uncharacterized protein n=1 Tax=Achaetomium macrosporum TaxID=79813 RepID=A0AAN7C5G5_9PEZI|nr:hypothetical protein C8A03DRAFT_36783 [Achaetomium macrosporum]
MEAQPIPDDILRAVYASDQAMYPVSLSYTRLRAWVDACPDLSICFISRDQRGPAAALGVVIVLPLRRPHWEDLLAGRLKEMAIDPGQMFPALPAFNKTGCGGGVGQKEEEVGEVEEVGLHVYHIERFDSGVMSVEEQGGERRKRFTEVALEEVEKRVRLRSGWRAVALTATPAGKRAFERLGFTPTGYREVFAVNTATEATSAREDGPQVEIICLYPGDEAEPAQAAGGRVISSRSEMVVRFSR